MKKIYLVSMFVRRPSSTESEEQYFAVRATGYRAAQNAATRKFQSKGYVVEVAAVERDDHGDYGEYGEPITAANAEELERLKSDIRARIAKYESAIAETNQLTDDAFAGMSRVDRARRLLPCHALTVAEKKLAALEAVR